MRRDEWDAYVRETTEPAPAPRWFAALVGALLVAAAWLLVFVGAW